MYNKSVEYIYSLERTDKEFNLEAISKFLEKIGNPHHKLKCIHVAGTNGKGSTCAFINQGLIDSGFKVGFFSSPHLVKFNERIRVNNELISDEELDRLVEKLDRLQKETGVNLTFFEGATVLAYLHFLEKEVDYVVLETGLGGRLDATTTCKPVMCVITSIGMDHMHMLGDTIEKIAFEKAGIIKKGVKVITSAKGKALEVIGEECWKKNCSVISIMEMDFFDNYQNENASLAYKVLFELNLDEEIIRKAILKTKWKGSIDCK